VTSRRYNTLSHCSNSSVSQTVKQQLQQQVVRNATSQFPAHFSQHPNSEFLVTTAEKQYFVLDPEQQ